MPYALVRSASPRSSASRQPAMQTSVNRAFRTLGWRKMGTALLTASTPVRAVQPLANARKRSQGVSASAAGGAGSGAMTGAGCPCARIVRNPPSARAPKRAARNRYVGPRKTSPEARTPRRFTTTRTARMARQSGGGQGRRGGAGGDGADPFGFLFGRAQRLAEEQLVQLHKRGCSAREMPAAGMLGRCSEVATFPSDFGTVGV